jgi:hypothetical protein
MQDDNPIINPLSRHYLRCASTAARHMSMQNKYPFSFFQHDTADKHYVSRLVFFLEQYEFLC